MRENPALLTAFLWSVALGCHSGVSSEAAHGMQSRFASGSPDVVGAPHDELAPAAASVPTLKSPIVALLDPTAAASSEQAPVDDSTESLCNEQEPQAQLIRSSYAFDPTATREEAERRKHLHQKAIEYRTRRYGYVDGFGDPSWNAFEPDHYATSTKFFGIPIRMNARVAVALRCVETSIRHDCVDTPYVPHNLDGIRFRNTFHNKEITNHAYGIAIDVDWDTNPCCGCVGQLKDNARCKDPSTTALERTFLPKCWVDTFDKYGFYWLGNDELEDTMHFEFLGDPAKIKKTNGSSAK